MNRSLLIILILMALAACQPVINNGKSDIEKKLELIGLQNVAEEIPGIEVYMVYATPYNFMGRVLYEGLDNGEISYRELMNRQLLREIMTEAGWMVEPSEWWHFNAMPLTEASQKLTVIK